MNLSWNGREEWHHHGAYSDTIKPAAGHWLGMDTHDTSTIRHDRLLQDGIIMAIEPGLYVPDEPRFGDFAGIGIRIEDDVAISAGGPRILSRDVPSDPVEIERLIGSRRFQ